MVRQTETLDSDGVSSFLINRKVLSLGPIPKEISEKLGISVDTTYDFADFASNLGETESVYDKYSAIVVMTDNPDAGRALVNIDRLFRTRSYNTPYVFAVGRKGVNVGSVDYNMEHLSGIEQLVDRLHDINSLRIAEDIRPRVLVIDDDLDELSRMDALLRKNGCYVETTSSVDSVVERAGNGEFDVVMLEKVIADRGNRQVYDGTVLSRDIRRRTSEAGIDTKIILSTLILSPDDIELYGDNGVDDIIRKPASDSQILNTLQDITSRNAKSARQIKKCGNVLVVDDYPDIISLIKDALGKAGFEDLYSAGNVRDSLNILDKQMDKIDVVICDWRLPSIDKLLDKAKEYNKQVVVMSGLNEGYILRQHQSEADFLSKIDAYFKKPFDITQFVKTVQSLCEPDSPLRMPEMHPRGRYEIGKRIILTGPSTSGKSTLAESSCRKAPSLEMPTRLTTRGMRPSDRNGVGFYFLSDAEFSLCGALEGIGSYTDGGNRYSPNIPDPDGKDYIVPVCSVGFREMARLYEDAKLVYCGISLETMAERLKNRPGNEASRYDKAQEALKTFREFFPISGSDRVFDEIILTDNLSGNRISNTLYCTRKLLRYIASQRN